MHIMVYIFNNWSKLECQNLTQVSSEEKKQGFNVKETKLFYLFTNSEKIPFFDEMNLGNKINWLYVFIYNIINLKKQRLIET